MKRLVLLIISSLLVLGLEAQVNKYGVPFIKNYPAEITQGSEQNWCITKDKFGDIYFGNQDRGVIHYDGTKWSGIQIKKNPRIYSLASDSNGIVYVGAAFEFGYIQPDEKGKPEYVSLAERIDSIRNIKVIYSIALKEDRVYFLGPRYVYIYDIAKDSLSEIKLRRFNLLDAYKLVKINDRLIITDNINGIFELQDSVIKPMPGGDFFRKKLCTVLLQYDESKILVCTYNNGVFLYDYNTGVTKDDFIDKKINDRFKEVVIYAATMISEDLFAIGTTTEEGLLVFDRSGKLVYQIRNENCDMEDNTIYALYCDYKNNSELWISTYGIISKVYFNIPLTKFAKKQGIDINVNAISRFRNDIYLSSDAGILKSYIDKNNNVVFRKLPETNDQFFPLEKINSSHGEYLLSGSRFGIFQIFPDNTLRNVESALRNIPGKPITYIAQAIYQSEFNRDVVYFGLESGGILVLKDQGNYWEYKNRIRGFEGLINNIVERNDGLWFVIDDPSALYKVTFSASDTAIVKYGPEKGVPDIELFSMVEIKNETYLTTASGILRYDKTSDSFVTDNNLTGGFSEGKSTQNLFLDEEGDLWYSGNDTRNFEMLFKTIGPGVRGYRGIFNLLPSVPSLDFLYTDGKMYMTKSKIVTVVDKARLVPDSTKVNTRLVSITVGSDSVLLEGTFHQDIDAKRRIPLIVNPSATIPAYVYDMNEISFQWTTPYFIQELQTEYSWMLEGYDKGWSKWQGISFGYTAEAIYSGKDYTNLPYGHYNFKVRARTVTNQKGNEINYEFIILKPFYLTTWFIISSFLILVLIISILVRALNLVRDKKILEIKVAERTAELALKNLELLDKNRNITASIEYAERIQRAILPQKELLETLFKDYFVIYKPRDIVSGDFYWGTKIEGASIIAAVDCTGHGVPGAFMSILGAEFLNEIINKEYITHPGVILRRLRKEVIHSLQQRGKSGEQKDGMDIALCAIDNKNMKLQFAGANNPLYLIRSAKSKGPDIEKQFVIDDFILYEIKGNKMPISIYDEMDRFTLHEIDFMEGDVIFLFTDGFADQFGGPMGKKLQYKNFKKLLLANCTKPMEEQKVLLENSLGEWMRGYSQVDDILVIGIRIHQ
jgi:serine phosphatase RsbU (regulator of sigma subunit)